MKDCREITEMMERSSVERISLSDKIGLRFHLMMCKACRQFSKDRIAIDVILTKRFKKIDQYSFSKVEKENLKNNL